MKVFLKNQNIEREMEVSDYLYDYNNSLAIVEIRDFIVSKFETIPYCTRYIHAISKEDKAIILRVLSNDKEGLILEVVEGIEYTSINTYCKMIGKDILEVSINNRRTKIINLITGEVLLDSGNQSARVCKLYGRENNLFLLVTIQSQSKLMLLKEGKLELIKAFQENSEVLLLNDVNNEATSVMSQEEIDGPVTIFKCNKNADSVVIAAQFDSILNVPYHKTRTLLGIKGESYYLYNYALGEITKVLYFEESDKKVSITTLPLFDHAKQYGFIINHGEEKHLLSYKGQCVEMNIDKVFAIGNYLLDIDAEYIVGYTKVDGTVWMYNFETDTRVKLPISSEDIQNNEETMLDFYIGESEFEAVRKDLLNIGVDELEVRQASSLEDWKESQFVNNTFDFAIEMVDSEKLLLLPHAGKFGVYLVAGEEIRPVASELFDAFNFTWIGDEKDVLTLVLIKCNKPIRKTNIPCVLDVTTITNNIITCKQIEVVANKYVISDISNSDVEKILGYELNRAHC